MNITASERFNKPSGTYTAILVQRDDCWIGWIAEVPGVNCQETTRTELMETLRETLGEALEFTGDTP